MADHKLIVRFTAGRGVNTVARIVGDELKGVLGQSLPRGMLDGHFHAAGTAVVVPEGRSEALVVFNCMIEDLWGDGTIRKVFDAHGMETATTVPAGSRS